MNRIFTGTLLAGLLVGGHANAQTAEAPPGPTAAGQPTALVDLDAAEAKAAFEEGVAAYQSGDYPQAAERFARAQLLRPHPEVLLNLAQSQLKARQYPEAATNFHAFMLHSADDNATARNGFAQARTQVVEVTVLAEEGAPITVDGTQVGVAPLQQPLFLTPGAHQVEVGQRQESFTGDAGTSLTVDLLNPPSANDATGTMPPDAGAMSTDSGRQRVDRWFVQRPGAWAGAGIAATSLVFSAIAATTSGRSYDAANDAKAQILAQYERDGRPASSPCGPPAVNDQYARACDVYTDNRDSGEAWKTTSIVTLVVGLVAAGGTVAYYFLDPENQPHSTESLQSRKPRIDLSADMATGYRGIVFTSPF